MLIMLMYLWVIIALASYESLRGTTPLINRGELIVFCISAAPIALFFAISEIIRDSRERVEGKS